MKRHTKIFFKYWKYGGQDLPECWGCFMHPAADIHHISGRGLGGDPKKIKDNIYNLIPLCRDCHIKTDKDKSFNDKLKNYLERRINENSKI